MIFIEIVMVLIGMGAVIYSTRLTESSQTENEMTRKAMHIIDMDTTEQMEQRFKDYQQKIEDIASDTELQTEDQLKNLSNESIMGISEYSDQVLDKIEKNHAEVIFLYNMLNEKQDELKETVKETDKLKAELRDEMSVLYQEHQEWWQKTTDDLQEMTEHCKAAITEAYVTADMQDITEEEPEQEKLTTESDESLPQAESNSGEEIRETEEEEGFNKQEEILDLYQKGHSVLEISKLLSIGQGEVNFVIGLYG